VKTIVEQLAAGLLEMGISRRENTVESRDKVAILSKNRPEWIMLDLAVQMIGGILTPIYPTINVNELEFVLRDAAVKMVFVNDEELFLKVMSLQSKLPDLKDVFTFEHVANARHWKEVLKSSNAKRIEEVKQTAQKIQPEDIATIIYTSGTTGTPKGVMLSHRNIGSNVMASTECFPPGDNLRALSFLPLNHIFERMVTYLYLFKRTSIYYAENLDMIGDNLREVHPDLFTTVPRLLEKVYDKIMEKGNALTGFKKNLFFWAHGLAEKFDINKPLPLGYRLQLSLADKLIFRKWREALGNKVLCVITGGAACQVRLIRIFTAAGIPIMEGYGLTETSPVICVNRFDVKQRMFGTVGPTIRNVEVKIAEDGEILCKGPNIMEGYYKRLDLTADVMRDGWFLTGDIGELIEGRFLKITDRKKELFKTSGGKYVAPLPIESKMKESPYIEQVMVVGAERKFTGALIIPAIPNLLSWCRENGIEETVPEKLVTHPQVKEFYRELVESFNKFFNQVEQVKKFELLPHDWSVESGELTPKLSLKRKVIMEKYRDAVERIYAEE
jgi:long-chain acyl-CoA synthetase